MKDTTSNNLAFALFCLCLLAAMFWPERGRAQTVESAVQSIKKDTILVDALCTHWAENPTILKTVLSNGSFEEKEILGYATYVTQKRQERTFKEMPLQPPYKRDPFLGHAIVWEWRLVEIQWLDPIDGCYQLVPLKD